MRLFIFLSLFLLAGCGALAPQPTATPLPTPPIAEAPSPTTPPTPTASPTQPVAASPTAAPTQAPTATSLSAAPTEAPAAPEVAFPPTVRLEPFTRLDGQITYLTHAGDGSGRTFLVEKVGRIWVVEANGDIRRTPFLDISDIVDSGPSERGLLSVAFDPNFAENGEFYVNFSSKEGDGDTVVARYQAPDGQQADPATGVEVLRIDQPAANHNGGQLQFGPDGYLYIGMGDGGSAGDPWDNAENLQSLLGKMLRIKVSGEATYAIPPDNPFVGRDDARLEIWAYGLRNPWRFSFDRATGDMYIADVGQNKWEEVDFQPADSPGGEHYGWNTMEGNHCYDPPEGCDTSGKVLPVWEYPHPEGCSITGGYVYRGQAYPQLTGLYFYGDFCSGKIYALRQDQDGAWESQPVLESGLNIASFGEDESGELYVLDLGGGVYRLAGEETGSRMFLPLVAARGE